MSEPLRHNGNSPHDPIDPCPACKLMIQLRDTIVNAIKAVAPMVGNVESDRPSLDGQDTMRVLIDVFALTFVNTSKPGKEAEAIAAVIGEIVTSAGNELSARGRLGMAVAGAESARAKRGRAIGFSPDAGSGENDLSLALMTPANKIPC